MEISQRLGSTLPLWNKLSRIVISAVSDVAPLEILGGFQ